MNRNLRLTIAAVACMMFSASAVFPGWLKFKPLKKAEEKKSESSVDPRIMYRFFDEDFVSGGYAYWYPENSKVFIPEESGKNGEVAIEFDLDEKDYSGGSVCLYNLLYDLRPLYATGALQFWIKGNMGGEIAWAALVDDENADREENCVRLPLQIMEASLKNGNLSPFHFPLSEKECSGTQRRGWKCLKDFSGMLFVNSALK